MLTAVTSAHPVTPTPGTRYKLIEPINSGRYGTVYKAYNELGQVAAVKKLLKHRHDVGPGVNAAIIHNEIQSLHRVQGRPNIVRLYDIWDDDEAVYLVQEYCPKGDLETFMKHHGHKLNERRVSLLMRQVLTAIDQCHIHNVYHGDMKPANIMISRHAHLKLIDFGQSQISRNPYEGCIDKRGTPMYASPELFEGFYGHMADLWPAGIMTYMMLHNNEHPFLSKHDRKMIGGRDIFRAITEEKLSFPNPHVSRVARDFLHKTLQVDPRHRFTAYECLQHPFLKK